MLILHLTFVEHAWFLWGEAPPAAPRRGRPRAASMAPLPFGAGTDVLAKALEELGIARDEAGGPPHVLMLWLPTRDGLPLPSSPLIQDVSASDSLMTIAPWQVVALPLADEQVISLVGHETERDLLAPGIMRGAELRWLVRALRFALDLAARQRAIPSVRQQGTRYLAVWQPVFTGNDDNALAVLARAMPATLRAAGEHTEAPTTAAGMVAAAVVARFVDHLMRDAAVTGQPAPGKTTRADHASLHDLWLAALAAPDGALRGPPAEVTRFAASVREWTRTLLARQDAPFRLCLRLEEPEADDGSWTVRYLARARTDQSLLVALADLWQRKGAVEARQALAVSREDLLAALGQAAQLAPDIAASLKQRIPWGYTLDNSGAHRFLTETAWLLEEAGLGVLLPAWWTRAGARARITARARAKSPRLKGANRLSLESLVDVDWSVALGDATLTLEELERLARLKEPLVRVRGQWVQVDAAAIAQALAFWKKRGGQQLTLREILQLARGGTIETAGLAVEGVSADGWIAELLAQLDSAATSAAVPLPAGLRATLRPYQVRGYSWLHFLTRYSLGACLADDMGLGKTVQTLTLIQRDWEEQGPAPVLLICPTSVLENWRKEAQRFTPDLPVMIHHGATRRKAEAFAADAARQAIVLTSYSLAHRDLDQLQAIPWRGVVLDEAQNIKNGATKQAKATRAIGGGYRIALTGTPVENHVGDLWSIMTFLNAGYLGTESAFRRQFFLPIQVNRDAQATATLQRLTGPFILRRVKTDPAVISDLPEKLESPVYCSLTREQATLYAAALKELDTKLDEEEGIQRKGQILATLTKLKQICNHPAQFLGDGSALPGRSGKVERLEAMLGEMLDEGERALIFTQYAEMGELLQRHLQAVFGCEALLLTGRTPRAQRDRMVDRFQRDEQGPPIFLLSLKAGGVGLNLTRASHVFHFDRWWNPAVENQATDRAFRIGQTKRVLVHTFITAGTVEDRIADLIASKREIAAQVVGTGEGWITELSSAQIRDLFALRETILEE